MRAFDTKTFFLLASFLRYFEPQAEQIVDCFNDFVNLPKVEKEIDGQMVMITESLPMGKVMQTILSVLGTASEAEAAAVKLLAYVYMKTEDEIRNLEAYDFLKLFREFLVSVDWSRLMGESMGLSGAFPAQAQNE